MTSDPIRLGVAGLGRGFMLMLPAFRADPRFQLAGAAAPRAESREAFAAEFGAIVHDSVDSLCADPTLDAIYIATPHQLHADHVIAAARSGKHVLVDKPLAVSMSDGRAMVQAAREHGVHLIVGPSHSFDTPVALARSIIDSGEFGRLRMVQAFNYTDFLYRPRRPEELRTDQGGGVLYSQAIHQIDVVRYLAGGQGARLAALTGNWDPQRATEGAYAALLSFAGGAFATLMYSGYAHFDSDRWMGDVAELGQDKAPGHGAARRALQDIAPEDESAAKMQRTYGRGNEPAPAPHHEHFGPVVALCDRADLRLTPDGVEINGDLTRDFRAAPLERPRAGVLDALHDAVRLNRAPVQDGAWGLASLEICHAILRAAETGAWQDLSCQSAGPRT